jgi:predicted ATPase/DNA-binding winged helix-turn-helix (wHTH) protein
LPEKETSLLDDWLTPVRFGVFHLDPGQRKLTDDRGEVRLGSRAMDLLLALVRQAGMLVSQRALMAEIWPGAVVDDSSLRVSMSTLRKSLRDGIGGHRYILNEHGRGYRFVAPVVPVTVADLPRLPATGNIPAQLVRLIGRSETLDSVLEAFGRTRLVTLVGAGGIGKSTLALAAAHRLSNRFPGGTQFIDLALIESDERLASHVATILGAPPDKGLPYRGIAASISSEPMLLLLDNCEHVLGGVAQLVDSLFSAAPQISILATSRAPIRARDEQVLRLPGMPFPQHDAVMTAADAMRYPAVELFVERAASASNFRLTDENTESVARLSRQLDGIPLAIEFAAGWVRLIPIDKIAAGLDSSLLMLAGGRRTALPRHQTLFAVLDWSYRTLSPAEQEALAIVSVFSGTFTLSAAKSVGGAVAAATSLDESLASLAEKSLLTTVATGNSPKYRLLATTRSYAARHLSERSDHRDFLVRHARTCTAFLRRSDDELLHLSRQDWARKYGPLLADVRAALAWCFSADGDPALGVELTSVSSQLGMQSVMANDFHRYALKAVDHLPNRPDGSQQDTKLRFWQSMVDFDRTDVAGEAFAALTRATDNPNWQDDAPEWQAAGFGSNFTVGNYPAALSYAERVLAIANRRDQPELIFAAKRMIAQSLHHLGQHAEARSLSEDVLACPFQFLPLTTTSHQISMRINLARIAFIQGDAAEGLALAAESAELGRDSTPTTYCQALTHAVIPLSVWTGDVEGARDAVEEVRKSSSQHGLQLWIDWTESLTLALEVLQPGGVRQAERISFALSRRRVPVKTADFLSTFEPSLLLAATEQRVASETVMWCASEVLRGQALATDDRDLRLRLLRKARRLAIEQGAAAWVSRAESSILATGESNFAQETNTSPPYVSLDEAPWRPQAQIYET